MYAEFQEKVALVTGASSGIGRATAVAFAKEGANVVLSDILQEEGEELADKLSRETGSRCLFVPCDVSKPQDIRELIQETVKHFKHIHYAFNNAGIEGQPAPTADCTEDNWERTINTNLRSVWLCMKYQLKEMLKANFGVIVNNSSIAGVTGFARIPAYVASKHGVIGLTRTAALEYASYGIRVNAVCPGVIHTPMIERFTQGSQETEAQLCSNAPMCRAGTPEEIAGAVLWLCSDGASFTTGQPLVVDGGWTAK